MSYLFRDQRVINELERPKSSDFNIAQSLQTRNLAATVQGIYSNGGVWSQGPTTLSGFDGPRSMRVTRFAGLARAVEMSAGIALGSGVVEQDIGGISGVSNYGSTQLAVLSLQRILSVPAGPTEDTECRVDVIAIKPMGYLAEYAATDIFSPSTQSFGPPVSKPKTYRWDLYDVTMQELSYDSVSLATSPLIYIKGAVSAYSDPDSFLSAPLPSVPAGYIAVAAINVRGGSLYFNLPDDCVRDLRYILSPGGNRNQLYISALCGSKTNAAGEQGYVASYSSANGGYTTPQFIVKNGASALTNYQFFSVVIFTNFAASRTACVTGAQTSLDITNLLSSPAQVIFLGALDGIVTSAFKSSLADTDVTPSNSAVIDRIAVGQKYISARFALAKPTANTSTGEITLSAQATNFGKANPTDYIIQVPLALTVDWYPFSYD